MMKRVLKLLPVYLLVLLACGYGIWQFVEKNEVPDSLKEAVQEVIPTEPTTFTPQHQYSGPELAYAGYLEWGESFTVTDGVDFTGTLECSVDSVRIVTEESQCPPEDWFHSRSLGIMNLELGRMQLCPMEEWFTEGGAFDQGCRLVVVDMTVKNIDAQSKKAFYDDPTQFDMGDLIHLVDRNYVSTSTWYDEEEKKEKEVQFYQGFLNVGYSLWTVMGQDDSALIPPGESVSFSVVFPVHQNDDGTAKDLSKLALTTTHPLVKDCYLYELTEGEDET